MRGSDALVDDLMGTLANRAVDRSLGDRRTQYAEEIQRVLEATYDLIEQTGNVDPSLRDILAASNLSTQAFYRYFQSKDELFLLLLDDGRRRLVGSLERRMNKATTAADRVRAWIEGVLAQASDTRAAGRTRPFLTDQDRLAEAFPREQQASVDLLVDLLAGAIVALHGSANPRVDAVVVYRTVFATLRDHLIHATRPTAAETEHLVRFCLDGIGGDQHEGERHEW
jgi:AcrR family transcriptional regulator